MTAENLFDLIVGTMGLMPSNASTYRETYIPTLNTILSQTLGLENVNREYKGLTLLEESQKVTSLSDELTYQDNVLRNVVAFGVAQLFALSDDDTLRSGFFEQRYADGMNQEDKTIMGDIKDWYGNEE